MHRIVTVGGSGVGIHLIKRILGSWPLIRGRLPSLHAIVVAGPRIDPHSLDTPTGVEIRAFVPDLDQHLAPCDLAIVQGGLTTCMELTAAGTPFLYWPHNSIRAGVVQHALRARQVPCSLSGPRSAKLRTAPVPGSNLTR